MESLQGKQRLKMHMREVESSKKQKLYYLELCLINIKTFHDTEKKEIKGSFEIPDDFWLVKL